MYALGTTPAQALFFASASTSLGDTFLADAGSWKGRFPASAVLRVLLCPPRACACAVSQGTANVSRSVKRRAFVFGRKSSMAVGWLGPQLCLYSCSGGRYIFLPSTFEVAVLTSLSGSNCRRQGSLRNPLVRAHAFCYP